MEKDTNPKSAFGSAKMNLHLWPMSATVLGSLGLLEGALKYGRCNWREKGAAASIYYDALLRHMALWFEGEDQDPKTGVPHLGNALACLAILVDSIAAGTFVDDRQFPGNFSNYLELNTPTVNELKELFKDRDPQHYTIETPTF